MSDEDQIEFECSSRDWLRVLWPALFTWGLFALVGLMMVGMAARFSLWCLLLLIPWWFIIRAKATGIVVMLLRGKQRIMLLLPPKDSPHRFLGVSNDGGKSVAPFGGAKVEAHQKAWLLWGGDGRWQTVVPKNQLSQQQRDLFRERLGVELSDS